jgi:hypothetical protein
MATTQAPVDEPTEEAFAAAVLRKMRAESDFNEDKDLVLVARETFAGATGDDALHAEDDLKAAELAYKRSRDTFAKASGEVASMKPAIDFQRNRAKYQPIREAADRLMLHVTQAELQRTVLLPMLDQCHTAATDLSRDIGGYLGRHPLAGYEREHPVLLVSKLIGEAVTALRALDLPSLAELAATSLPSEPMRAQP